MAKKTGVVGYLTQKHDPLTGLVLTIPVFLVYHLGILVIELRNGVDLFTELTFALLERSLLAYVGLTVAIAVGLVASLWFLRRKRAARFRPKELVPVLVEGVVLAIVMMFTVGWATQQLLPGQVGPPAMGPLDKIVMSCGAGFHEELVFRAGLFAGGAWLLARRLTDTRAFLIAMLVSSILFSAVHYVGPLGDPFTLQSFLFRLLAGVYFVAVYHFRGFAVAVYTHTIYDLIVMFFFV